MTENTSFFWFSFCNFIDGDYMIKKISYIYFCLGILFSMNSFAINESITTKNLDEFSSFLSDKNLPIFFEQQSENNTSVIESLFRPIFPQIENDDLIAPHYIASKLTVDKSIDHFDLESLTNLKNIEHLTGGTITHFQQNSLEEVFFNSTVKVITSKNHLQIISKDNPNYSQVLKIINSYLPIKKNPSYIGLQQSYDFDHIFKRNYVINLYSKLKNNKTEIISLILISYKNDYMYYFRYSIENTVKEQLIMIPELSLDI